MSMVPMVPVKTRQTRRQRRESLLCRRHIVILKRLPDLTECLCKRRLRIAWRPLPAALKLTQCGKRLLRAEKISEIERTHELIECLAEVGLATRRLARAGRERGNR